MAIRNVISMVLACTAVWLIAEPAGAATIDYKRLYNSSAPAVVLIHSSDGKVGSQGTGSIIDRRGLVLTNTHVITHKGKNWPQINIYLKPDTITGDFKRDLKKGYRARVVAKHPKWDLALVQIIGHRGRLPVLALSTLDGVGIGEPTVAIGHPGGGAAWSLTTGTIGASFQDMNGKRGWHVFQTETALNPGNSGGPLLDGSGAVIGINTFIRRRGRGGLALVGLNFAVKSSSARAWIQSVLGSLPSASELEKDDRERRRARIAGVAPRPAAVPTPRARAALRVPTPPTKKPMAHRKAPPPPKVAQSAPPRAKAKVKIKPRPRVVRKDGSWALKAKKKRRRRRHRLRRAPRRAKRYTSKYKSGMIFGGDKLRAMLNQRSDEAFDELDRALGR